MLDSSDSAEPFCELGLRPKMGTPSRGRAQAEASPLPRGPGMGLPQSCPFLQHLPTKNRSGLPPTPTPKHCCGQRDDVRLAILKSPPSQDSLGFVCILFITRQPSGVRGPFPFRG